MKVVITPRGFANYGEEQIGYLKDKGLEVDYNNTGMAYTPEVFLDKCKNTDAIIVGVDIIDKDFIDQCPKLKVVCKFGVGVDNIDVDYAKSKGIYIGRTVGSNSNAVAEHVIALMLADSKNICKTVTDVKAQGWNKPTGYEVSGKTLGIIGFGAIGKLLAKHAVGLDMNVLVNDSLSISQETLDEYHVDFADFQTVLKESDYLSLHLPLLESTKNLIGQNELAQMKSTACLINTSRGGIVDENVLCEALENHTIRSACFDVFTKEPPESDEKLLQLDNFILTSHIAARTVESEKRTCETSTQIIMNHLPVHA